MPRVIWQKATSPVVLHACTCSSPDLLYLSFNPSLRQMHSSAARARLCTAPAANKCKQLFSPLGKLADRAIYILELRVIDDLFKITPFDSGGSGFPNNARLIREYTRLHMKHRLTIGSTIFAQLTGAPDTQTTQCTLRATSVAIGRITALCRRRSLLMAAICNIIKRIKLMRLLSRM